MKIALFTVIQVNPKYFRPAEVETLLGDASKAKKKLGWEPKIGLREGIEKTYEWYKKLNGVGIND